MSVASAIGNLLTLEATGHVPFDRGDYLMTIFSRPKKDGSQSFNSSLEHHYFKMETLYSAIHCVSPKCWLAYLAITDAYFQSVTPGVPRYLRYLWESQRYQFTCECNSLFGAPVSSLNPRNRYFPTRGL